MKPALALLALFAVLTGCRPNQHVWDALAECEQRFNTQCSVLPIPNTKADEMAELYQRWEQ